VKKYLKLQLILFTLLAILNIVAFIINIVTSVSMPYAISEVVLAALFGYWAYEEYDKIRGK
jgi:hypothetical protein